MRLRRRRGTLVGFAGLAAVVTLGSYAWACVQVGSHTGLDWICKTTQTVTCNFNLGRNLNPTHGLSFYDQATGLTPFGSYDKRWVSGDHHYDTDSACNFGAIFSGGANIIAGPSGAWAGQGPLMMPNITGIITICAVPLAGNNGNNFIGSSNTLWTLI